MTDFTDERKYTADDIRRAIERADLRAGTDVRAAVMAELERLAAKFRKGEVVRFCGDCFYDTWAGSNRGNRVRRLRLSEMPQAVEDLRAFVKKVANDEGFWLHSAEQALAAFDEEIEP